MSFSDPKTGLVSGASSVDRHSKRESVAARVARRGRVDDREHAAAAEFVLTPVSNGLANRAACGRYLFDQFM